MSAPKADWKLGPPLWQIAQEVEQSWEAKFLQMLQLSDSVNENDFHANFSILNFFFLL